MTSDRSIEVNQLVLIMALEWSLMPGRDPALKQWMVEDILDIWDDLPAIRQKQIIRTIKNRESTKDPVWEPILERKTKQEREE